MSAFEPQPLAPLLARALAEFDARRAIFDLPRRSFWRGAGGRDLSLVLHGARAATPLGPAAGPHTQLAQNLVLGWLAGARVFELKTVQVLERLEIPRPCIDVVGLGYNVEWSQELTLAESLEQYVAGWILIQALAARGVNGAAPSDQGFVFEPSVGYDLAGIRSPGVAGFLDALRDTAPIVRRALDALPPRLRAMAEVPVPDAIARGVTLSTMHGCRPGEIEAIVEHLFDRHALDVCVKLNPTLLGFDAVDDMLCRRLGYDSIALDRTAFEDDLRWDEALEMIERLATAATRRGLGFGVKLTNTLRVRNTRGVLAGEAVYLSGHALHPAAVALADRIARATAGRVPLSFSAGVDAENVVDVLACGFAPVTTCTDLLRPTGYRRLPRYLKAVDAALDAAGATSLAEFVRWRAEQVDGARVTGTASAATLNLSAYARRAPSDPRYHASAQPPLRHRAGTELALLDCASCNACLVACPNDAVFTYATVPGTRRAPLLRAGTDGMVAEEEASFTVREPLQWAVYDGFCNDCGNCGSFCPERGGPWERKARVVDSIARLDETARDAIWVGRDRVVARVDGVRCELNAIAAGWRFTDGVIDVELDPEGALREVRARPGVAGHALPLARAHALLAVARGVRAGINPVTAPELVP